MTPLAWLRSQPRRTHLVTVAAEQQPRDAMPTGFITYDEPVTQAEAEQIRTALQHAVQHIPVINPYRGDGDCGCVPRYTSCRCRTSVRD